MDAIATSRHTVRVATRSDADDVYSLIVAAYAIEKGSDGVAFTSIDRLSGPHDLYTAIDDGGCLVCFHVDTGVLLGCIVFHIDTVHSQCHFGPFAVAVWGSKAGYWVFAATISRRRRVCCWSWHYRHVSSQPPHGPLAYVSRPGL